MRLLKRIFAGTLDPHPWRRFGWVWLSFFVFFFLSVIVSFLVLPEGFLRGKHPIIRSLELSPVVWIAALQIFAYNLMPTAVVAWGNLYVAPSRLVGGRLMPQGYLALWALALYTGAILGSWSFELVTAPGPPLWLRMLRMLDITRRSGLLELTGYVAVAAASARWSRVRDGHRVVSALGGRTSLQAAEWGLLVLGLALVATAAMVESRSIVEVTGSGS
ncbi:MAG TPA: hypothetical protein VIL08_06625 [Limnochorda sp.]